MKTSNLQSTATHPAAIIRGWVGSEAAGTDPGTVTNPGLENASGGALAAGDVVVVDSDGTITTTTTQDDPRPKGIVLDDIDAAGFGPVAFAGPVPLVNVGASVTAGDYFRTSTVAGEADDVATPTSGTFGYFTSSGTTPSGFLTGSGSAVSPGGGGSLPWFDVTDADYGAVGDGTTDDTAAINLAIAALIAAGKGVLYFPAGTYKTTAALTALSVPCQVLGDGMEATIITCTSATVVTFTGTVAGIEFRGFKLDNTHGTPTAGAGIKMDGATVSETRIDNVQVRDFYDGIVFEDGFIFTLTRSYVYDPVRYGVWVQNLTTPDAGDSYIAGCTISAGPLTDTGSAGIRVDSSGGLKIIGNKINGTGSDRFDHGIHLAPQSDTSILLVTGNSIENVAGDGFHAATTSGVEWDYLVITSNQFGLYTNTTGSAININCAALDDIDGVVIADNVYKQSGGGTAACISLTKVDNVYIGPVIKEGWGSSLATSGCTNVIDNSTGTGSGSDAGTTFATLTNKSGGSVAAGDVVVVDTGNDDSFTTTTTSGTTLQVGIALATIANNATGTVQLSGYTPLVNVAASVTRGHYGTTHTVAKQATSVSTKIRGAFCQFLTGGTTPTAWLFGVSLPSSGQELAYNEFTSSVSPNATTEATANTVVTASTFTGDGKFVVDIEFYAFSCRPDTGGAGRTMSLYLYDDIGGAGAASIGRIALFSTPATGADNKPCQITKRIQPSAATHSYSVRGAVSAGTGSVGAGAGGSGADMPGYIRIRVV